MPLLIYPKKIHRDLARNFLNYFAKKNQDQCTLSVTYASLLEIKKTRHEQLGENFSLAKVLGQEWDKDLHSP